VKKFLVVLLLSILIIPNLSFAQGQKKYFIEGTVTLSGTSEPIPYANVLIKELNLWASTSADGKFKIPGILPGSYTLEVSSLGYQKVAIPVKITQDYTGFKLQLNEENLKLNDVVVTATPGSSMNSSSRIDKTAIQHLQATSLADVMQLLPGNVVKNPTLNEANYITIRSLTTSASYNSRGVGIVVNGAKVSNDASISSSDSYDFRNISTDNIESVEVLKGVVSAEYGDLTSGAIIVKTKTGRTPYDIRIKSDPRTKAVAFSKGFSLGKEKGTLNVDVDYARSFSNMVSPVNVFDRTTLGVTYSNTFNRNNTPFQFNIRVNGYVTGNSVTSDPDVSSLDFTKSRNSNLAVTVFGNWQLNKPYITSLNYNVSANAGRDYYRNYVVSTQLPLVTTSTKEEGIALGYFTGTLDKRDQRIEEIPVYINAKLTAALNKMYGTTLFRTTAGLEFNSKGNEGRGEYYIGTAAPQYFRERHYNEIPYLSDLSFFAEEKINVPIGSTNLDLSAGVRFNKMLISGYNYDPTFDPRFNVKYTLIKQQRKGLLRQFDIRAGWGILQRLPSIGYLYPAPNYIDNPLFSYTNSYTGQSIAVIQTSIIDGKLPYNLKTEKTTNIELGIDFDISGIKGALTYFKEKLQDGITGNYSYMTKNYDYYNSVTDPAAAPKFENGRVYVLSGGVYVPLAYTTTPEFEAYVRPDNRGQIDKWGLEYDLDFGKIKALNTSILLSGAYIKSKDTSPGLEYSYLNSADPINSSQRFPYVGIYEGDSQLSPGTGRDRLTSSLNFVTNIPSIRMVVSLTTQFVWLERSWNLYDDGKIYSLDSEGNPVYGDYNNKSNSATLYRNPVAFMDMSGNIYDFDAVYFTTTDPAMKTRLNMMRKSSNYSYYFLRTSYNPYAMANIRITKEIGNLASLSFYANNFTNAKPIIKNNARPNAPGGRKNTEIYFGAELKITF
jgi:hypothetical protein